MFSGSNRLADVGFVKIPISKHAASLVVNPMDMVGMGKSL